MDNNTTNNAQQGVMLSQQGLDKILEELNYLKTEKNLVIGEKTAERIKKEIGSAYISDKDPETEIKGIENFDTFILAKNSIAHL